MNKYTTIFFWLSFQFTIYSQTLPSQEISGPQLLKKSIAHHDPNGAWAKFKGGLHLTENRPNGPDRRTHLHINNKNSFFELIQHREENELVHVLENEKCIHLLNKSKEISNEDREKHKLNCDRTKLLRDYYLYLWGLPMKLNDAGTQIHDEVLKTQFQGKEVLQLKVTYDESISSVSSFETDSSSSLLPQAIINILNSNARVINLSIFMFFSFKLTISLKYKKCT